MNPVGTYCKIVEVIKDGAVSVLRTLYRLNSVKIIKFFYGCFICLMFVRGIRVLIKVTHYKGGSHSAEAL